MEEEPKLTHIRLMGTFGFGENKMENLTRYGEEWWRRKKVRPRRCDGDGREWE